LIDLLDRLRLPASVIVNSAIYSYCPEVMAAFRERGDEVVAHGRTNAERQGVLDEGAERALIVEAARTIATAEGVSPQGWLGPWISQSHATLDLLAEQGFRYCLDWCMDDQPIWLSTRGGGRILSIPYPQELNDIPAIVARKDTGRDFAEAIVDGFDEMLRQAEAAPLVMGIALHPYIVGQPQRLGPLREALAHITAHRDRLWLTTAGGIASHIESQGIPEG
jgi:peptidoglycan/xylan/chitin deacetylase (PgdA/CDA1 family)